MRWGLATRLLGVFALVIAAAAVTAWGVAAVIGPRVFHEHMVAAGVGEDHPAIVHAEQAFRSASATSLAVAFAVAVAVALALSVAVTRRVSRSLRELAAAAERVAGGEFDLRVDAPGLGREFDAVTEAFTDMATDLAETQALRDRLVADVAHELRTPVATISAYLEAIEDGVAALTPETIALLRQQTERLTRLAQDLLAAYRAEHGDVPLDLELMPVADLLGRAAAAARPAYRAKGVDLVVSAAPNPWVEVDSARCAQVLANLMDNALRHTPPGGRVALTAAVAGGMPGGGPSPGGPSPGGPSPGGPSPGGPSPGGPSPGGPSPEGRP
ncbi:MAG: HAMP domain-containing histidine kinase, partial [Bifidobacteriaceae bacterium]|nr:HAMP domain-containing histidine kinase [Bifidobacteriaceae bacterium]